MSPQEDPFLLVDASQEPMLPDGVVPAGDAITLVTFAPTAAGIIPPTFQWPIARQQALFNPNDLFTTAVPTAPGVLNQKAFVNRTDSLVDLYQYDGSQWVKKLVGLVLNAAAGAVLPTPAGASFTGFSDTQAGGSVTLVPAAGVPLTDYRYKVGAAGDYQAAPADGVILVGNIAGAVYAYSVATAARNQGPVSASTAFTAYTAPGNVVTTPSAPTFSNYQDTQAGGSIQLVPAANVPLADYRYSVGPDGPFRAVPTTGIITVENVAGSVYAYSVPATNRNQSAVAVSTAFTAYVPPTTGTTTPNPPTFSNFQDTNAGGSVQLVPANGVPFSDYLYKVGSSGTYAAAPLDGVIAVGNIDGQVYAYSVAAGTRNQSLTAASQLFTSYTPPTTATVPDAPTNVTATAGNARATVNGTPPANNGGAPISGYAVYRNGSLLATTATLPYVDTTALNGTAYTYALAAINSVGTGAQSAATSAVTPAAPVVTPPSFNTTLSPGDNVSTLTFSALDGNRFLVNLPLSTNTDPNPATMLIFLSNGTQTGQVDYNGADTGTQCGYQLTPGGQTYLITFTNGNVTLS